MILLPLFSCKKGGSAVQWYFPLFTLAFLAAACAEIIFELQIYQWAILLCLMIALLGCLVAKRVQKAKYILCAVLGCGIGLIYIHLFTGLVHTPINALDQTEAEVYATVTGYADRYEDTQRVTIKVDTRASGLNVWVPSFSTMAYVPLTEEELSPGDQIQGHFSFYQGSSNGGFDRAFVGMSGCQTSPEGKIHLMCSTWMWNWTNLYPSVHRFGSHPDQCAGPN